MVPLMFADLPISEKQQNGKVLSEYLVETAAHDWADLGNAREMGKEIHATYHHVMEATWGPDHITTVPEDYTQQVILGVRFVILGTHSPVIQCLSSDDPSSTSDCYLF